MDTLLLDELVLKRAKELTHKAKVIDMFWEIRNISDATDEDEWDEYENLIGLLAELSCDFPHLDAEIMKMWNTMNYLTT